MVYPDWGVQVGEAQRQIAALDERLRRAEAALGRATQITAFSSGGVLVGPALGFKEGAGVTFSRTGDGLLVITAASGGTAHNLLSATHADTTAAAVAAGDLVRGNAAGTDWERMPVGTQGQYLVASGGAPLWRGERRGFNFLIDGGGAVPTVGIKGTVGIPFGCTVANWRLEGDQAGSATVDVLSAPFGTAPAYASMVGAGTKPVVTTAVASALTAPAGWTTTAIAQNTSLQINLVSVATFLRLTLYLELDLT